MNVIRYIKNNYVPNVALIVDFSGEHRMLVGEHTIVTSDLLTDYKTACKDALNLYGSQQLDTSHYDIFTIDMYGYRQLFCKIDTYVREVFLDWQNLLAEYLTVDLSNLLRGNTCEMSVLSTSTSSYLTAYLDKRLGQQSTFMRNNVYAARLINVAFPKGLVKGFCHAIEGITPNDDGYKLYSNLVNEQTTYNLSDFRYVDKPSGQQFDVMQNDSTRYTLTMTSSDGDYEQVLCDNSRLDDLRKLEQYLTVEVINGRTYVKCHYNPNRVYKLTSNYHVTEQLPIQAAIQVLSNDMKQHARNAGILYADMYILLNNPDRPNTITLDAVYSNLYGNDMTVRSWRTADYRYDTYSVVANGNWTAASYQYVPVQTNDNMYSIKDFTRTVALYNYGNLCTFMIDAINKQFGYESSKLHTFAPIDNGFDAALDRIDLPVINKGKVTFRNIRYTMYKSGVATTEHDGKRFAVVLQHTERLPEEYQEVTAIRCRRGAYFNTALHANEQYSVYMDITPADTLDTRNTKSTTSLYYYLFGLQTTADVNGQNIPQQFYVSLSEPTTDTFTFAFGANSVFGPSTFVRPWSSIEHLHVAVQKNTCTLSHDDKIISKTINMQDIKNVDAPLLIGACFRPTEAGGPISGTDFDLHYCKVYDKDKLIRDYVPCFRKSDNAVGLYDMANGRFLLPTLPHDNSVVLITGEETSNATDTTITAETLVSANYVVCKLKTNLKPLLNAAGKRSFDSLTIADFYRYNAASYMPRMIATYVNLDEGFYACRASATAEVLDMDLPLEPLD